MMVNPKEILIREMESYFNGDARRINHALRVTAFTEQLMEQEGGDYPVVIGAAVLHDIGIPEAKRKYGSVSGKFQEIEGPPIAREILTGLGFENDMVEEICEIIAHHHSPGKIDTLNFRILYDSDWLVNLEHEYNVSDRDKLGSIIDRVFLTETGKTIAREIYLSGN